MKKRLIVILFVVMGLCAKAQTPLSVDQCNDIMASLTESAASMQSIQCRFVQTKTMAMLAEPTVSEGTMVFVAPDRLRWEYTTPYPFSLVVNGDRIVKVTDGKEEVLSGKSGRMYQGILSMILDSASGKKLFDTSSFDIAMFDDNNCWKAEMTPKRRDMKRMFSQLVFYFDKTTQVISHVEFVEAGGDVTSIRFEDIKVNEEVEVGK